MKSWKTMDKTSWGRGAWDDEDDKYSWIDEACASLARQIVAATATST